jgi:hypothetical protein
MKNFFKKVVMLTFGPPVKYIISQLDLYSHLEKRFDIIENILQDAYPNEWVINERSKEAIESVKKQYDLPEDMDTGISKNDLMFRYFVLHGFSLSQAFIAILVERSIFMTY